MAVFFGLMAVIHRYRRDRLKEEVERHYKTPMGDLVKARDVLSKLWRVSEHTPLPYDRAFSLGLFSGFGMFLLVPVLMRGVSPPVDVVALILGILVFLGAPYLTNDILLDGKIKNFRANIEFGLETMVSTLLGTAGDLPAAIEEVARVGPGVVGKEFTLVHEEVAHQKPLKDAFAAMSLRLSG
jgi:Flp pilus assembly protein TadB